MTSKQQILEHLTTALRDLLGDIDAVGVYAEDWVQLEAMGRIKKTLEDVDRATRVIGRITETSLRLREIEEDLHELVDQQEIPAEGEPWDQDWPIETSESS